MGSVYHALIADDERAELEGLSSLLQKAELPFCVTLCDDGAKAYNTLQQEPFDLLISDIVMPQMDGLTLCTNARALNSKIVTVISSAYGDFKYTQTAIRIGVDDYLLKPIVVDSFYQTMARMLDLIRAQGWRTRGRPCAGKRRQPTDSRGKGAHPGALRRRHRPGMDRGQNVSLTQLLEQPL